MSAELEYTMQELRRAYKRLAAIPKFLFIDDSVDDFTLLKHALSYYDVVVTHCSDFESCKEKLEENFSLILLDWSMPNEASKKVLRHLIDIKSEIPVVIFSGQLEAVSLEEALNDRVLTFIAKPITTAKIGQLLSLIKLK